MESINKRAFSEVIEVLNHTEKEVTEKIPGNFVKFLYENADRDYKPNINFYDTNWEESLDDDTKVLLAMIYRDYIVSKEERIELLEEERREKNRQEEIVREKYNPDNLFKKSYNNVDTTSTIDTKMVEVEEAPWFKRLLKKILRVFGKNN